MGNKSYQNLKAVEFGTSSVKFLEVQWFEECGYFSSNRKDKLLFLAPPTIKKEVHHLVSLFEFQKWYIPYFGLLSWSVLVTSLLL